MVKRLFLALIIGISLLLGLVLPALAVDVDDALYYADVVAANSGDAATDVAAVCSINTQALIDGNYCTSDLLNTAIQTPGGTDVPYMPGVGASPWCIFFDDFQPSESKFNTLYTGGPAMQTSLSYFPDTGGMTSPDSTPGAVADDGGSQTNETTAANNDTANDMTLLPAVPAVNDAYYFGGGWPYSQLTVNIGTQGAGTWTITWEYWNGAWTALSDVTDNTNGFTAATGDRTVTFTLPDDWATTTVQSISAYWARARVSAYTSVTTQPKGTWSFTGLANLELGNNFTIEQRGYVDTSAGSDKNLAHKQEAFKTSISASVDGMIRSSIYENQTENLSPDGNGYYTTWAGDYTAVDDPVGAPDEDTTKITGGLAEMSESYSFQDTAIPSGSDIKSLTVYVRARDASAGSSVLMSLLYRQSSTDYWNATTVNPTASYADYSWVYTVNPATSAAWTISDMNNMEWGVRYGSGGSIMMYTTQIYVAADYYGESFATVFVIGISPGVRRVVTTASYGSSLTLSVYDENDVLIDDNTTPLWGKSVPNNGNPWSFGTNGSILYLDYHKMWVSGTLLQHIVYERDTTFDDLTEYNNNATPTFRTTSSDAEVTCTLQNFRPIDEAICTAGLTEEAPIMLDTNPTAPPEFYGAAGWGVEHLPGAALINNVLDAAGIPRDFFWIMAIFGAAAILVHFSYGLLKSMLFPSIFGGVVILFFSLATGGDPIPLWTMFIYLVIVFGVLTSERTFGL